MRTNLIVTVVAVSIMVALAFCAGGVRASETESAYSHGETSCLQGNDGPGLRLRLRQTSRCEGRVTYPYLQIDIRELPIAIHRNIQIGGWPTFSAHLSRLGCPTLLAGFGERVGTGRSRFTAGASAQPEHQPAWAASLE